MFLGLRTAAYKVRDIAEGKKWYSKVLGIEPYFDQPFYVGFSVGGFELGLTPTEGQEDEEAEGVVVYWGVEDIDKEYARLLELGAVERETVREVGDGIKVATVKDPFGNVLGIIFNPHFGKNPSE